MIPLPVLPTVDGIGFNVLFGDEKEADRWMEQKKEREEFLCSLIKNTIALHIADPNNASRFFIVSPGIRGKKYSLSMFSNNEAIGDWQRDNPKDFIKVIPDDFVLVDMIA